MRRNAVPKQSLDNDGFDLRFVMTICFVAAGGGFLFGYDLVVIGGARPFYEAYYGITQSPWMQGWAISSALVGCLVGAIVSGILADRLGRKRLLIFAGLLFVTSAIGTATAQQISSFNWLRFAGGIAIGLASNLSPMYIAEVAPASLRGRMVSINQLSLVVGILMAQVINFLIAQDVPDGATLDAIAQSWNGTSGWRWMFAAESIPASLFVVLMLFIPETPRWLVKVGRDDEARGVLERIGGENYATVEFAAMSHSLQTQLARSPSMVLLQRATIRRLLVLGVFLAIFQQWCGINVIFNYAQEIFAAAGYGASTILLNIVITGVVNLLFTLVAMVLVDRLGRRRLMLLGALGLAIIHGALGLCYYNEHKGLLTIGLVISAIAVYAMTLAPVTWVVISEIFPNPIRGPAVGICVFALWSACSALTLTFPYLNQELGPHGTFWLYGLICLIGYLVVWRTLPETAGRSLEEMGESIHPAG